MTTIIAKHGQTYSPSPDDVVQFAAPLKTLEGDPNAKRDGRTAFRWANSVAYFHNLPRLYEGLGNTYRVTPASDVPAEQPQEPTPDAGTAPKPGTFAFGANFPNASNGTGVGTLGKEYSYQPYMDFYQAYRIGCRLFRLGYRTTRIMQSEKVDGKDVGLWDQPLIADAVTRIRANIKALLDTGPDAIAIPEMHDYGRAFGVPFGVAPFDVAWIVRFWADLLGPDLIGHPRVFIDLNNEPHLSDVWQETVTALVPAMREAGISNTLVIEGVEYSGARGWAGKNGDWFLSLYANDKALMASPHLYLDDGSGETDKCAVGSEKWADSFIAWVKANQVPALIGEFGYSTNSTCKDVMPAIMAKFREAGLWVTAWTYSFYMPQEKYHFALARPANYAVEPNNRFKAFVSEGSK